MAGNVKESVMAGNVKESVRLCEHIVRQAFGDVVCRVASTLLNRGRLPIQAISMLSALSRSSTLASVLLLMQHNLVLSNGANVRDGSLEQYEFDVHACLMRLRWGRILALTSERLGTVAVEIIQQLMIFGRLKAPDIVSHCAGYDAERTTVLSDACLVLVQNRLIEPTSPKLQVMEKDDIERRFKSIRKQKLKDKGLVMLSPNDLENCMTQATHEVREERKGERHIDRVLLKTERQGKKKKTKNSDEFDYSLDSKIILRINYERFNILIRDELIIKAAEDRYNRGAADVMRALLAAALTPESALHDTRTYQSPAYNDILERIKSECHPRLLTGITGFSSHSSSSNAKAIPEVVRQYLRIMSEADAMAPSGNQFLTANEPGRTFTVELERISSKMRETLLVELVKERLGSKAARVLATVLRAGKVSETGVRDYAMITLKDARYHLAELQKLSLVETQEIPKSQSKSKLGSHPQGEWHLWQIDQARVYSSLLAGAYKTLGNIMQRREIEVERKLTITQRENVHGRDRLHAKDQEDLTELDDTKRKLGLAEMRTDMVVFVLRDMPGWPGMA